MEYGLTNGDMYFCGWDQLGFMKFTYEKRLAYRMRKPLAERTLEKVNIRHTGYRIIRL